MAFPSLLNTRQVTSVPFDAFVAIRLNDSIIPPLGNVTNVCEDGGTPLVKITRIYPVKLVAHSNVTVSLTYTYCVSGTIVKTLAPKICNNFDDITIQLTRQVYLGDHNYSNKQRNSHDHGGVTMCELKVWCVRVIFVMKFGAYFKERPQTIVYGVLKNFQSAPNFKIAIILVIAACV